MNMLTPEEEHDVIKAAFLAGYFKGALMTGELQVRAAALLGYVSTFFKIWGNDGHLYFDCPRCPEGYARKAVDCLCVWLLKSKLLLKGSNREPV
mgnify:CR=1 FL=1